MKLDASNRPARMDLDPEATCVECGHSKKIHRWNGCHVRIPVKAAEVSAGFIEEGPTGAAMSERQCSCPGFR